MDPDRYHRISLRAYEIWQQEGCPWGRDREHWSRAVAELEEQNESTSFPPSQPRVATVLVVDDEPLIRFAAVDALEDAGFEVVTAANADEAVVLLETVPVDAVFTDIKMPGVMNGLDLVSWIRARSPDTRVIVTSGHVRLNRSELPSGVSFLSKPYEFEVLGRMLATLEEEE